MNLSAPKRKIAARVFYWTVSIGLAAVLLYYSLRGVDWPRVWSALRGAKPPAIGIMLASISIAMFLRAIRWRVLLSAEGAVPAPLAFWATAAGYLGNNVLPARAGEIVRSVMIGRRAGLGKTFVLTTALSERMVDAIALIAISAGVLLTIPSRPGWLAGAAKPFAAMGLCGAAAIALLPLFEPLYFKLLARLPIPHGLRQRLENALKQVVQGLRSFHDRGRLARFLTLTAVIWCADAATAMVCARAISVHIGLPVAFLLIAGMGLSSALPSTPGYVGIYQFVAVGILTPFGISRNDAIACIVLLQAAIYVVVLTFGSIGLWRERAARPANTATAQAP